jgi:hypothetical protein
MGTLFNRKDEMFRRKGGEGNYMERGVDGKNVALKGLSSEIYLAESGIN